jgi:hypothetical protein
MITFLLIVLFVSALMALLLVAQTADLAHDDLILWRE